MLQFKLSSNIYADFWISKKVFVEWPVKEKLIVPDNSWIENIFEVRNPRFLTLSTSILPLGILEGAERPKKFELLDMTRPTVLYIF